jgi:hypothetical protein
VTLLLKIIVFLAKKQLFMTDFEKNIWNPLIEANDIDNRKLFNKYFKYIYCRCADKVEKYIYFQFEIDKNLSLDFTHDAFTILLINILLKKDIHFDTEYKLIKYLKLTALGKAKDRHERNENGLKEYISDKEDEFPINSPFADQPSGNVFRDIYEGTQEIDVYLAEERETLKLLELSIIDNLSYKEIVALEEYSHYKEATLRKKVERGLKKYKDFIKK